MRDFKNAVLTIARTAKKNKGKVAGAVALGLTAAANAAVTMPTPDYTNIESAAGIGFGIVLTVGLLSKAKRFFR